MTSPDDPAEPDRDESAEESAPAGRHSVPDDTESPPDPFAGPDWHGPVPPPAHSAAPARIRRRRMSRRRRRRRHRVRLVVLVAAGVLVLVGAWVVVTALLARSQLATVRDEVRQLRAQIAAGDLDAARATARQISTHADKAHTYTAGPAWAVVAAVPVAGRPFATVRTITDQVDVLGQRVLPEVITATRQLDPSTLRNSDGTIDLARISAVTPGLDAADATMTRATSRVAQRPASTWLGPVDSARSQLLAQMRSLGKTLHSADLAARIAPAMLGANGPKRYFVGFQNDAEARGTGGLPGAFGIVRADHGKISVERFESDQALHEVTSGLHLGAAYDRLWSASQATEEYVDSNVSPHFPYAARIWLAMWQKKSGERLDGAIAVDPTTLSYLLAVTGPVTLPDKSTVTSANVVALTQQTLYERYPSLAGNAPRKAYLLAVAKVVSDAVLTHSGSTTALVKAAGRAGAQRRLLIYSTSAGVEANLEQTSLSGAVNPSASPYVGLVVNNDGGNKLDYYLDRSVTWTRTGCGSTRQVTVTVRLTNAAPANVTPYAAQRNDHPPYPTKNGDNRLGVYYYGTPGAFRLSTQLDGKLAQIVQGSEQGHPVWGLDVEMPRGQTRTIVFRFREPPGAGAPVVLRQPLVRPLHVTIHDQSCG